MTFPIAVARDGDLPPDAAGPLQPPGVSDGPIGHVEGVVAQGDVAQAELLAEPELEGEGGSCRCLPVWMVSG